MCEAEIKVNGVDVGCTQRGSIHYHGHRTRMEHRDFYLDIQWSGVVEPELLNIVIPKGG